MYDYNITHIDICQYNFLLFNKHIDFFQFDIDVVYIKAYNNK